MSPARSFFWYTCVSASARQSRAQCRAREFCCEILFPPPCHTQRVSFGARQLTFLDPNPPLPGRRRKDSFFLRKPSPAPDRLVKSFFRRLRSPEKRVAAESIGSLLSTAVRQTSEKRGDAAALAGADDHPAVTTAAAAAPGDDRNI